jgi:xanthine dehydrogenase small subunit
MRDHLLLYVNGRRLRVDGDEAFLTLSDFLRRRQRLTGTKVVCAEGDCGACAVMVGRPAAELNSLRYCSVNSCIQLMFQLDATHIVTIEGLTDGPNLNPVQRSMVACQGTQCGFCTPGFVVSLCDLMQDPRKPSAHDVRRALTGNLCRCTGYDTIIRAALQTDRSQLKSIDALYPPAEILKALTSGEGEEVRVESPAGKFFKPASVESAVRFRRENPNCLIVSGATDLGVQRNKGIRRIELVMSTAGLREMREITVTPRGLSIGAGVNLMDLERAAGVHLPELSRFLEFFGSPLIRNAATLAGNLINASPIGDLIPALLALDGEIELTKRGSSRWVKGDQFYTGYRRTVLASDEIVTRVLLPLPSHGEIFKLYKVSRRKDLDISAVNAGIWMRAAGENIQEIRLAFGGVGPVVVRLAKTEAFLVNKPISLELFEQAGEIARGEIKPISDVRGSEDYRRTLAGNILIKFWHDLGREPDGPGLSPLPVPAVREPSLMRSPEGGLP